MHIAIATTEFITEPTFTGGLSNFSTNLACILREHGHKVDVFVTAETDETIMWKDGIYVYRVKYTKDINSLKYVPTKRLKRHVMTAWCLWGMSYVINKRIREVHKCNPFQIVHFCDSGILWACSSKKIPSVVRLSSSPSLVRCALLLGKKPFSYDEALKTKDLQETIYQFELRKAKTVIAPSHLVGDIIEKQLKKQVIIIESPFCTNVKEIDYSIYDKQLCGKKYFLFFGTLNYLKGIYVIAQIIQHLFESYQDIFFVFMGCDSNIIWENREIKGTELLKMFAGEYSERVIFLEPTAIKEQVYGVVSKAELIILPSRVDNLPNTCIESMALGKVVIGTQGASFEQLIIDGYSGWLIERDNPESLLRKIGQAMNMTDEEKKLFGERAKKRLEKMSPEEFYKNIMRVYNRVTEGY